MANNYICKKITKKYGMQGYYANQITEKKIMANKDIQYNIYGCTVVMK